MIKHIFQTTMPRLPLDGNIDLTYRCNNRCVHCWLWEPNSPQVASNELTSDEILRVVQEARRMGCQTWAISGGEPMLRDDFAELFDFITYKSVYYKLNTNGTLITPKIAQLMKRTGRKMIAMYGASAEVHDKVTRNPGSFDAFRRGLEYLKEAGATFEIQIVPMKANFHQYDEMLQLAALLSPHYRIGAPWLWMTGCHSETRNREIAAQRLDPCEVVRLDFSGEYEVSSDIEGGASFQADDECFSSSNRDDRLFASCIDSRRDFHIDPYGGLSFCYYIKDPELRFDLKNGTFEQGWDEFIPSLKDKIRLENEYYENCGSCSLRKKCRWCGVYGFLETGDYSRKVDYLCEVAKEAMITSEAWVRDHVRYYQVGGVTLKVATDFPVTESTYAKEIQKFQVSIPGKDTVNLQIQSTLPEINTNGSRLIYDNPPWEISEVPDGWLYKGYTLTDLEKKVFSISIYNKNYSSGSIYHRTDNPNSLPFQTLTTYTSDLILLSQLLINRDGCCLHASGIKIDGKGYLFVGHSGVGKSTMMKLLRNQGEILCDDRIILRRWADGYRIHGNWSHGELSEVSPGDAPIKSIYFLKQASENRLIPIIDKQEYLAKLLGHLIKPLLTVDWWQKTLNLTEKIVAEIPAYDLQFNLDGKVINLLQVNK